MKITRDFLDTMLRKTSRKPVYNLSKLYSNSVISVHAAVILFVAEDFDKIFFH